MGGAASIFSGELHSLFLLYVPNIRKPANKEANDYHEKKGYRNMWLVGILEWYEIERGRLWEATTEPWYFLHPALKYRPEEHPDSTRIKRNLKMQNFELMWHQIISTATLNKVLTWALHSQREKIYSSFPLPEDVFLALESLHTPQSFLELTVPLLANPAPKHPRAEEPPPTPVSLSLSQCARGWQPNGMRLSSRAPPTMPRCLAWPALGEKCLAVKERLYFRVPRASDQDAGYKHTRGGVIWALPED